MPISPKDAAKIAKEHGLSLSDARAIAAMADSEEDAKELAQTFAPDDSTDYKRIAEKIANKDVF